MKEMLKKSFAVLGVVALLASAVPSFAATAPLNTNGGGIIPIVYVGAKVCRVANSTTASLCSAAGASGMLYSLCAFGTGTAIGAGAQAFDTASASGITTSDVTEAFAGAYAISPFVIGTSYIHGVSSSIGAEAVTCWSPPVPIRYASGLVMKNSAAVLMSIALVRPDTGTNP